MSELMARYRLSFCDLFHGGEQVSELLASRVLAPGLQAALRETKEFAGTPFGRAAGRAAEAGPDAGGRCGAERAQDAVSTVEDWQQGGKGGAAAQ